MDPFIRLSLTPELLYWRLHGNKSHYARYTDAELLQILEWLDRSEASEKYVMFNNIPRVHDVKRLRELAREQAEDLLDLHLTDSADLPDEPRPASRADTGPES